MSESDSAPSDNAGSDIAIYTLFDLSADELAAICAACEKTGAKPSNGENTGYIHPAPQPTHASVDAAIAYHRALDKAGKWDAHYFAIAETADWRDAGILAVTLNTYDFEEMEDGERDEREREEARTVQARGYDTHRFRADAVGIMFINLQIANMEWAEHKEWDAVQPGEPDSDDEEGGEKE
ncbi:hypothetical protein GSI_03440 [Ganoderma sinense ZZ0214-1]|uniref:Uncharacterized protein n=1 Tax=Ganoderma sinense ZZ0214-1 TaxID=1077348 RepID=A0A2G8SLN7_9APHY|nr:hypothetical protein GSI_03440 [Ganoderma sinense ZZ0214-1]